MFEGTRDLDDDARRICVATDQPQLLTRSLNSLTSASQCILGDDSSCTVTPHRLCGNLWEPQLLIGIDDHQPYIAHFSRSLSRQHSSF